MSFINKFKDFMGIGEEDFEDDFEENEQPEEMEDDPFGGFSMQPEYRPGKTEPAEKTAAPRKDNKVVNINTTTQLQVVLVKPEPLTSFASLMIKKAWGSISMTI